MSWQYCRPYLEPRTFPYLVDNVPHNWQFKHSADNTFYNIGSFWDVPYGPDPALFDVEDVNLWLYNVLWVLAGIDTGPVPPGALVPDGGGGRIPPLV